MYRAILFHPAGDYVTDFPGTPTIQEVWDQVADMGSRWIFYPIVFVATEKTIVDTPDGLKHLKRKRIKTVEQFLKDHWEYDKEAICEGINAGLPFNMIYNEI